MIFKSFAKINIGLDIKNKINDYHNIETIIQTISLFDLIHIEKRNDSKIILKTNSKNLPTNKDNLAYKAVLLMKKEFNINFGVNIFIGKNIPISAGLGGGSSNAATVMYAINKMFNLNCDIKKLIKISSIIGTDVPSFFLKGTIYANKKGTHVKKIKNMPFCYFLIIKPNFELSTKLVYDTVDKMPEYFNNNTIPHLLKGIEQNDLNHICKYIKNSLEPASISINKDILNIKNYLLKNNAISAIMSGSGSSVYGIFKDKKYIQKIIDDSIYKNLYLTTPYFNNEGL